MVKIAVHLRKLSQNEIRGSVFEPPCIVRYYRSTHDYRVHELSALTSALQCQPHGHSHDCSYAIINPFFV